MSAAPSGAEVHRTGSGPTPAKIYKGCMGCMYKPPGYNPPAESDPRYFEGDLARRR